MMGEFLNTVVKMNNILFEGWSTSSTGDVVLASFLMFLFTFLFESLKALKLVIVARRKHNPMSHSSEDQAELETTEPQAELLSSLSIPSSLDQIRMEKTKLFIVESLLHTMTFAYAYFIMLVVMTYSVWFLLAVILGSGLGFWISNPISQKFTHLYSRCPSEKNGPFNFQNFQAIEIDDPPVMTLPSHSDSAELLSQQQRGYDTFQQASPH